MSTNNLSLIPKNEDYHRGWKMKITLILLVRIDYLLINDKNLMINKKEM